MRTLPGVLSWCLLWGCAGTTVQVLPSLTPIDPSKPFFIYKAVKGTACGENAVAAAMEDLYRVGGDAHGFVSATIEQQLSGERCVTITARPMTYGCSANEPKRIDVYPMKVVPGPAQCAGSVDACAPECARYAAVLAGTTLENQTFRERCVSRCRAADAAFLTCARAVASPADVRRCDALN